MDEEEDYGVPHNDNDKDSGSAPSHASASAANAAPTPVSVPMIPRNNSKSVLLSDHNNIALHLPPAVDRIMARRPSADCLADLLHLPPPAHSVVAPCRVGILLHSTKTLDRASRVMDHYISFCKLTALCLLEEQPQQEQQQDVDHDKNNDNVNEVDPTTTTTTTADEAAREWVRTVKDADDSAATMAAANKVRVYAGQEGVQAMLAADDIDAIYVVVPTESHRKYVLQCLRAKKHVLIRDFRSTNLNEFQEQLAIAREQRRFVQFSTMFDIQYNVQAFLDTVSTHEHFGKIDVISAELEVCNADLDKVGASNPLKAADSCIHRLARYCILMALLMTPAEPAKPVKAQITKSTWDGDVITAAHGHVVFEDGRELFLSVGYSTVRTRQWLEVRAATKYAVVTEFAMGTHGLHSFRVYDKEVDPVTGKSDITGGEALDVPSGLPQHVMMWRGFAELCQSVTQLGWDDAAEATFLTQTAISLKATIAALEESARCGNNNVVPIRLDATV